ncbi:hypothetical protein Fmac_015112 [Flemingia macrophylla]|uniref:Uncharacterized protein n=1 Tax=Flemingia macrophylla TaxID=520843 RepID=A0ABD1MDP4_9FABA
MQAYNEEQFRQIDGRFHDMEEAYTGLNTRFEQMHLSARIRFTSVRNLSKTFVVIGILWIPFTLIACAMITWGCAILCCGGIQSALTISSLDCPLGNFKCPLSRQVSTGDLGFFGLIAFLGDSRKKEKDSGFVSEFALGNMSIGIEGFSYTLTLGRKMVVVSNYGKTSPHMTNPLK